LSGGEQRCAGTLDERLSNIGIDKSQPRTIDLSRRNRYRIGTEVWSPF
jgi:hypothetical protein